MADDDLVTGEAVALDLRPTGFALRAASAAIDLLATVLVGGGALWLLLLIVPADDIPVLSASVILLLALFLLVIPATVETASRGKSLGRLAVGARVVRDDGGAIAFRHAFVRALVGVLELYLTFGGVAAVVGLLAPRTKRLGDLLAGTYAMQERVRPVPVGTLLLPAPLAGWARIADVARMPDRLTRRIETFLRQAPGMLPTSRVALAAELAAEASRFAAPLPDAPQEAFLIGVAVLRRDREAVALTRQAAVFASLEPVLRPPHGFPERG